MSIVGRKQEIELLKQADQSPRSEFLAVYGRRRVGKTYLVSEYYQDRIQFQLTGRYKTSLKDQLANFAYAMAEASGSEDVQPPNDWQEAFFILRRFLEKESGDEGEKRVIFFDELPWLASRKSDFLAALEHFWNTWASRRKDVVLVTCGSAASWMIKKLLNSRGGLHNRITRRLRILPFDLGETEAYLQFNQCKLTRYQIAEIYMTTGGIPQYLNEVHGNRSTAQNIESMGFREGGFLKQEFQNLFASLFEQSERHESIVRQLATRRYGYTRSELSQALKIPSGGRLSIILDELEQSGFIKSSKLYGKKGSPYYRLTDEYSLFYLKWIEPNRDQEHFSWQSKQRSQPWISWSGFAFETLCWKHIWQIRHALGITGMETVESPWQIAPKNREEQGAQIDLVIDRKDGCVHLCEMKFTMDPFEVNKAVGSNLRNKRLRFEQATKTRKALLVTMITSSGMIPTPHSREIVAAHIDLDDLFVSRPNG